MVAISAVARALTLWDDAFACVVLDLICMMVGKV
jgi:hypothetical protein